jgi:hypothetical protein
MPPIQWVRLRQKSIEWGSISTFLRMDEPVVDSPDVDSKNESINEGMAPLIRYGNVPKSENTIQESVTDKKPSLLLNLAESASLEII